MVPQSLLAASDERAKKAEQEVARLRSRLAVVQSAHSRLQGSYEQLQQDSSEFAEFVSHGSRSSFSSRRSHKRAIQRERSISSRHNGAGIRSVSAPVGSSAHVPALDPQMDGLDPNWYQSLIDSAMDDLLIEFPAIDSW